MNLQLNKKIKKSALELSDLNSNWTPSIANADKEIITEEERECLLNFALKMSKSLVLGKLIFTAPGTDIFYSLKV